MADVGAAQLFRRYLELIRRALREGALDLSDLESMLLTGDFFALSAAKKSARRDALRRSLSKLGALARELDADERTTLHRALAAELVNRTSRGNRAFESTVRSVRSPAPPAVFLQAEVFTAETKEPLTRALRAGIDHDVYLFIGRPRAKIRNPEPFEREELGDGALPLTLVFDPLDGKKGALQNARVRLDADGESERAHFHWTAPPRGRGRARVLVLFANRVVQTAFLEGTALRDPARARPSDRIRLVPDELIRPRLDVPPPGPAYDGSLFVEKSGDDGLRAAAVSAGVARLAPLEGMRLAVQSISNEIAEYTGVAAPRGPGTQRMAMLLRKLAWHGRTLFKELQRAEVPPGILEARRLQLVEANGGFLPLEFVYARVAPRNDAPLCSRYKEGLRRGRCAASCPKGQAEETVVCPLAFWGLSKVIERRLGGAGESELKSEPDRDRDQLTIDSAALFGASTRVDKEDRARVVTALGRLMKQPARVKRAADWESWRVHVKASSPSLLVLMVHCDDDDGLPMLELDGDKMNVAQLESDRVVGSRGASPLVLLMGCNTRLATASFQNWVSAFKREGAAVVLGTVATILADHASVVTARLVRSLAKTQTKTTLGDRFLSVKRELLAGGEPLVLALSAYGDGGWRIGQAKELRSC